MSRGLVPRTRRAVPRAGAQSRKLRNRRPWVPGLRRVAPPLGTRGLRPDQTNGSTLGLHPPAEGRARRVDISGHRYERACREGLVPRTRRAVPRAGAQSRKRRDRRPWVPGLRRVAPPPGTRGLRPQIRPTAALSDRILRPKVGHDESTSAAIGMREHVVSLVPRTRHAAPRAGAQSRKRCDRRPWVPGLRRVAPPPGTRGLRPQIRPAAALSDCILRPKVGYDDSTSAAIAHVSASRAARPRATHDTTKMPGTRPGITGRRRRLSVGLSSAGPPGP
ncbi:hypothetical protein RHODGE_RHODGE_04978 [Rhodoplanes serenus]|uniref:Uncharacterized protein n=1 Tax=Rhodoplanes serenus TaxID=200615 RepID=A0A447D1T1_9BRAD|nr:hypothetical protein RHODGE_RHODGE_04978 [Rhodoplanes serenus]